MLKKELVIFDNYGGLQYLEFPSCLRVLAAGCAKLAFHFQLSEWEECFVSDLLTVIITKGPGNLSHRCIRECFHCLITSHVGLQNYYFNFCFKVNIKWIIAERRVKNTFKLKVLLWDKSIETHHLSSYQDYKQLAYLLNYIS